MRAKRSFDADAQVHPCAWRTRLVWPVSADVGVQARTVTYMPRPMKAALLLACLFSLSSCNDRTSAPSSAPTPATQQLPTATEVFALRSECARLGAKLLGGNVVGSALTSSQVSRYNPKTNRCYVELTVQNADTTLTPTRLSRYLFDGQTEEILAYAKLENGAQTGMAFKRSGIGFEEATKYIDETMKDE